MSARGQTCHLPAGRLSLFDLFRLLVVLRHRTQGAPAARKLDTKAQLDKQLAKLHGVRCPPVPPALATVQLSPTQQDDNESLPTTRPCASVGVTQGTSPEPLVVYFAAKAADIEEIKKAPALAKAFMEAREMGPSDSRALPAAASEQEAE